jgi:antitoxin component YwqK of YwqJK toxin-antitoxin module
MTKKEEVNVDYWDNGNKKIETHLKNGKPEGLTTMFYDSGGKGVEGHYKNG